MPRASTDYASWDRAELDREYSPSSCAHRPLDSYLAEYAERSRMARTELRSVRDIAYGNEPDETLDLFLPDRGTARGLQVFFHGGYWSALSKNEFSYLAQPFVAAGLAFASINYSLLPAVSIDSIVRQSRAALLWLDANAGRYAIAHEKMFLSGHSAGAHLAAMCLASDWSARPTLRIGGACLISGVFDLAPLQHTSENSIFRLTPDSVERNSPLQHPPVDEHSLVLAYGEHETREFKLQTERYAAMCAARGIDHAVLPLPELDHFEAVSELADAGSALTRAALDQMLAHQ